MCICDERSDKRKGRQNSKVSGMSHMYVCRCICINVCVFVTRGATKGKGVKIRRFQVCHICMYVGVYVCMYVYL
jgi:hypothetical protein